MKHQSTGRPAQYAVAALMMLSLIGYHGTVAAEERRLSIKNILIESTPPGAAVYVIGGKAGTTPLNISERDIYPNTYPDDQLDMYGVVLIKKPGCTDYSKRLTLEEIDKGLHAQLDCAAAVAEAPAIPSSADRRPHSESTGETLPQRRLRQLKVLQELLDDGLISQDEERTIRLRILNAQ